MCVTCVTCCDMWTYSTEVKNLFMVYTTTPVTKTHASVNYCHHVRSVPTDHCLHNRKLNAPLLWTLHCGPTHAIIKICHLNNAEYVLFNFTALLKVSQIFKTNLEKTYWVVDFTVFWLQECCYCALVSTCTKHYLEILRGKIIIK